MTDVEICSDCKGVIYPFERESKTSCLCVPADYEQCAKCGFDHEYDPAEAIHAHNLIAWAAEEQLEASGRGPGEDGLRLAEVADLCDKEEASEKSRRKPG